jgi:hypothetical protein
LDKVSQYIPSQATLSAPPRRFLAEVGVAEGVLMGQKRCALHVGWKVWNVGLAFRNW